MVLYLDENEVCAGFCQGDGDGLADASGSARQKGGLSLEGEESVGSSSHCSIFYFLF